MTDSILSALLAGALLGTLYGLSFVLQQRRVFHSHKNYARTGPLLFARFFILIIAAYYMLHSTSQLFILVKVLSFLSAFWLVILNKKALHL